MSKLPRLLLALLVLLPAATTLTLATSALANSSVQIQDDARVLSSGEKQSITEAARNAPFAVIVWTSSAYSNKNDFYAAVRNKADSHIVVVGVDPVHRFSHISAATNTGLTSSMVTAADSQGNAQFGKGAWAAGITAAINTLASTAPASNPGGNTGNSTSSNPAPAPGNAPGLGGLGLAVCLIPILIIVGLAFFLRSRFTGNRGLGPMPTNQGMYNPNVNPGYTPGPGYNQGYNQGYGPGYNQGGSGVGGNVASGAIGALGGGVLGYELGKHQGEAEAQAQAQANQGYYQPGDYGNAPDFGGGTVDSAPGGSGPDFGSGSGSDSGGTVDSGGFDSGGGGADFGGGGDGGASSGDF